MDPQYGPTAPGSSGGLGAQSTNPMSSITSDPMDKADILSNVQNQTPTPADNTTPDTTPTPTAPQGMGGPTAPGSPSGLGSQSGDPLAAMTAIRSIQGDAQNSGQSMVDYVNNEAQSQQYKEQVKQALWSQKFGDLPMDENAFNKTSDGTIFIKSDYTPQGFMGASGVQTTSQNGDLSNVPTMGTEGGQTSAQLGTDTAPIAPFRALTQDDLITMHKEGIPLEEMKQIDDTLWSSENLKKNVQETSGDTTPTLGSTVSDYLNKGLPSIPGNALGNNSLLTQQVLRGAQNILPNAYQLGTSAVSGLGSAVSSFTNPQEAARQGGEIVHGVENVAKGLYDNITDPNAAARQGGEILNAAGNFIKSAQTQPLNTLVLSPSTIDDILSGVIGKGAVEGEGAGGTGGTPPPPGGTGNMVSNAVDTSLGIDKNLKTALMNDPHGAEYLPKFFDDAEKNGQTTEEVQNQELSNLADDTKNMVQDVKDGKSGIGKIYNEAYQAGGAVPVQGENGLLNAIDDRLNKTGFSVDDKGNISDNGKPDTLDISNADVAKLQNIRDRIVGNAEGGVLSSQEAHTLRQKLDSLIDYNDLTGSPIKNTMNSLIMGLRTDVGTAMQQNLPGFADLDKAFMQKLDDQDTLLNGIVYQGGARKGEIRDNIQQIIKTINSPNRAEMLGRLSEAMPDLGTRAQSIQNMVKLAKTVQKHNDFVAGGTGGAIGSAVGTVLGGIPGAIAGATVGAGAGMKVSRLISSLRLARLKNIVNTGSDIQRAKKIDLLNKMSARANMSAKDQAAAQKIIDKIHSTTTTADEIRATAKALQEENARAEEARQAQAKASAIKAQEQARQSQAQAKQAEAQKYSDIRAKNQNLGAVSNPTPVVNSEIPKIAESKPVETAISKPSKNIGSVNIDKYTSSPIEKSANKMAEHASKYVDGEMEKGNRPMDMGILSSLAHMMKQNNAGQKYRLGDVLKSPYLRDLYKDALDAPISIMDSSMKRGNTIGSYGKKSGPMKGEILLYGGDTEGINKLPDIILHEAAHAMRDVKGRSMSVDYHEVLPSQKPLPKISKPQPKANPAQNASKGSETEEGGMSVPEKGETVVGNPIDGVKDLQKNQSMPYDGGKIVRNLRNYTFEYKGGLYESKKGEEITDEWIQGKKAIADKRQAPNEEAIQRMKNNREAYQKSESHFSDEQNKWLNDRYSSSSTYDPRTEISEAYRNGNDNKAQELAKSAKSWVQGKMEEEQSIRNINRDRVDRNRADEIISGANINKETFDKHYNDESSRGDIGMAKLIGKQLKAIGYDVKGTEIGNGIQSFKGTEGRQSYYLSVGDKKIRFSNHGQGENPGTIYPRGETNEEYLNSIVRKLGEPQSPSPKISKPQPKANPAQNASKGSETEEGGMSVPEKGETKGTIPKELEPLAEEARKYKSAEEFVKSQPGERYFTGQRADWTPRTRDYDPSSDDSLMYGPGIYLTPDRSIAEGYARDGGVVHNVIANIKNPLKPTMKDWDTFVQKGNGKMKRDFLIRKGYDAVVDTKGKYKQVMIVNPETIHTEDQLRDLYNKATQQSPSPRISKPGKTEESLSPTTTESKGEMEKSIGNTGKSDTMGGVQSNKEDMIPKELEPLAEEAEQVDRFHEGNKGSVPNKMKDKAYDPTALTKIHKESLRYLFNNGFVPSDTFRSGMYYMIGNTESNKDSFIQISKKQFDFINNKDNQTIKTKYKDNNITFNENKFKSIYNKQGEGTHINDIVSSMA